MLIRIEYDDGYNDYANSLEQAASMIEDVFSEGCLPNKIVEVDFDKHEDELTEYGCSWTCKLVEL